MRERIAIQVPVESVDDAGQANRTWQDVYANEPAKFDPISGGETIRGKQVESGVTAVFTIHARSDIDSTMRVMFRSSVYGIAYVNPVDGGLRYIELRCQS